MKYFVCILTFLCVHLEAFELLPFKKIVLWGHKLHSHTHSYIHDAFTKAFKHLGYEVLWLDDQDNVQNIDFTGSLFITEGQVDKNIPLREDCFYILHNCHSSKYLPLYAKNRALALQVYTKRCESYPAVKVSEYVFFDKVGKCIYMPWATDLLPHEIDENKAKVCKKRKFKRQVIFIGTIGGGIFGNDTEIDSFFKAAREHGFQIIHKVNLSSHNARFMIEKALLAPAIQGSWQCKEGYIPCRIFKNISCGKLGMTNSQTVYELFNKKIVFNTDTYQLFFEAIDRLNKITIEEIIELMDFVRDHHTYLNRIEHLFYAIKQIAA